MAKPLKVQLFLTCLAEQFFPTVLESMVKIFEKFGVTVEVPENQTCCGQPFFNSGFQNDARKMALKWIDTFYRTEGWIVSPSGSCVDMIRHHYPSLFEQNSSVYQQVHELSARTFEFCEFLSKELKAEELGAHFPHRVAYHASCHLLRGLGIDHEPKRLLSLVKGLELVPLPEEGTCCGFGGVFSVVFPEISRVMLERKLSNILSTDVDFVTAADAGCLMNIGGGLQKIHSNTRAIHIIDILASGV